MGDPLSVVVVGAIAGGAAGGAATKFVETALTSGGKWIMAKFADHTPQAVERAQKNANHFLDQLGKHLASLEETNTIPPEKIAQALESPELSMALHNALISAAQTESQEKHEYLSQLIIEQINAETESTLALTAKLACSVVSSLTHNQLALLGFIASLRHIQPPPMQPDVFCSWMQSLMNPYIGTRCDTLDWQHLQALGCLQKTIFTSEIRGLIQGKNSNGIDPAYFETPSFTHIQSIWTIAGTLTLTTVGQLIGTKIVAYKTGFPIALSDWGSE